MDSVRHADVRRRGQTKSLTENYLAELRLDALFHLAACHFVFWVCVHQLSDGLQRWMQHILV